jgi:hypothetical protein
MVIRDRGRLARALADGASTAATRDRVRRRASTTTNGQQVCTEQLSRSAKPRFGPTRTSITNHTMSSRKATLTISETRRPNARTLERPKVSNPGQVARATSPTDVQNM